MDDKRGFKFNLKSCIFFVIITTIVVIDTLMCMKIGQSPKWFTIGAPLTVTFVFYRKTIVSFLNEEIEKIISLFTDYAETKTET